MNWKTLMEGESLKVGDWVLMVWDRGKWIVAANSPSRKLVKKEQEDYKEFINFIAQVEEFNMVVE